MVATTAFEAGLIHARRFSIVVGISAVTTLLALIAVGRVLRGRNTGTEPIQATGAEVVPRREVRPQQSF